MLVLYLCLTLLIHCNRRPHARPCAGWGAMSFIVVLGAPLGSLVLTPAALPYLRGLFYLLAVAQFALFGALKIGSDLIVWVVIVCITVVVLGLLLAHYLTNRKNRKEKVEVEDVQGPIIQNSVEDISGSDTEESKC